MDNAGGAGDAGGDHCYHSPITHASMPGLGPGPGGDFDGGELIIYEDGGSRIVSECGVVFWFDGRDHITTVFIRHDSKDGYSPLLGSMAIEKVPEFHCGIGVVGNVKNYIDIAESQRLSPSIEHNPVHARRNNLFVNPNTSSL